MRVQKILVTDRVRWDVATVVATYAVRWQIELFFKECKGTLGLDQYRFRKFVKVENWVQACLVAFVYLEWYRAQQLQRTDQTEAGKRWWESQRCYGVSWAVWEQAEEADLVRLYRWTATPSGRRKLRRVLRQSLPLEYRPTG